MLRAMPKAFLGFGLAIGFSANAFAGFSIVTKGDNVCRVESGVADKCLPLFTQTYGLEKPTFEILQYVKVRERIGSANAESLSGEDRKAYIAASVLTDKQVQYVLENYSDISARNVGFGESQGVDGKTVSKFYASVFIKGRFNANFTVQLEGELKVDPNNTLNLGDMTAAGRAVGQSVNVTGISDDKTEAQKYADLEALRYLEKAARYVHFKVVGIEGYSWSAVNRKTIEDVKTIIAPVVFGRVVAETGAKIIEGQSSGNVGPK